MNYWHHVISAAGLGVAFVPTLALFFAVSLVVGRVQEARYWVRAGMLLMFLAMFGLVVAAGLPVRWPDGNLPSDPAFNAVRDAAVLLQGMALVTLVSVIGFDVVLRFLRLRPPPIVRDLIMATAYGIVGALLLSQMGVNLAGIVTTSAVVTAVVGFSLQDTLGNIMGGMALQLDRTIGPGDWIRIDAVSGVVREIRWRQTTIETTSWDTIVVPNSQLMKAQVTVLGRRTGQPRQHRQAVLFNVDYRHAPTAVINACQAALHNDPPANVAAEPAPVCLMVDFKDSYATYAVRYWLTDQSKDEATDSSVRVRIYFALKRAGIPPAIPAAAMFNTSDDPARQDAKRDRETDRRLETLRRVGLFQPLTEAECHQLAARMRPVPYAPGEAVCRQGDRADGMYCILRGDAEVRVAVAGAAPPGKVVATLGTGEFFGEMGLMTGEPRTATVIAATGLECYFLDTDAFLGILRHRPEIAEDVSALLAKRRVELDAVREKLNDEMKRGRVEKVQSDLLSRMRQFFGLGER